MLSQPFSRSTAIFRNALGYRPTRRFATRSSFPCKVCQLRVSQLRGSVYSDSSIPRTDKLWPMHRRDFLAAFAASVGALGAWAQERVGRSKIVEVRLLRLRMVKDVGTLEPAWDKGGVMRFTIGGGSVLQ